MRHRSRAFAALTLGAALLVAPAAAPGQDSARVAAPEAAAHVTVTVNGMRSGRGQVLACLSSRRQGFPDCSRDATARKLRVSAAGGSVTLDFGMAPPGRYAVALVHDENGNGRMDKTLVLPAEGFGFSRDAPVRFGPPSFDAAAFAVGSAPVQLAIRMRYML